MNGRRGVLSAGTWCVDLNKTIPAWPVEDTMTYIVEFDRQNGGSGSNMAIDLKRLDPSLPVEAMGVIGDDDDGRFLLGRCESFGIDSGGLAALPGGATPVADCFNSLESGRRTHFYSPGVAAVLSPDHFDFSRTEARILHLGLPGAHKIMDAPWRDETTGWAATLKAARARGLETNLEMVSTSREKVRAFGASCLPHLDLLIVNDYEIGCVADVETRDARGAVFARVEQALRVALALGSLAMPANAISGVNGAGDAFAAGMLYGWHEGWGVERSLRLGHACAGASMREVSTTTGVAPVADCLALAEKYGHRPTPA